MQSTAVPDELLNPKELAKRLKMHVKTVYAKAKAGDLPGLKIGGEWRFDWEDVVRFLKSSSSNKPTAEGGHE
jgi:excisionase family DNA binding protein